MHRAFTLVGDDTYFSGNIPPKLGELEGLHELDISVNQLSGEKRRTKSLFSVGDRRRHLGALAHFILVSICLICCSARVTCH